LHARSGPGAPSLSAVSPSAASSGSSGSRPNGHQGYTILLYNSPFNPDKSGLKSMSLRLINEKTPLFNLYSSPLRVFAQRRRLRRVWVFVAYINLNYLLPLNFSNLYATVYNMSNSKFLKYYPSSLNLEYDKQIISWKMNDRKLSNIHTTLWKFNLILLNMISLIFTYQAQNLDI